MALTAQGGGIIGHSLGAQTFSQGHGQALVPRTINSAIGRVDGLSDRLKGLLDQVSKIHDAIGGPRNIAGDAGPNKQSPVGGGGAVWRLNESAEEAHRIVSEIEEQLSLIQSALG